MDDWGGIIADVHTQPTDEAGTLAGSKRKPLSGFQFPCFYATDRDVYDSNGMRKKQVFRYYMPHGFSP